MSASLVGSEMCIRDRASRHPVEVRRLRSSQAKREREHLEDLATVEAVEEAKGTSAEPPTPFEMAEG
eukprot:2185607-Alexandrium_andersonii.AAC.1